MKLGEIVRIKNITICREMFDLASGKHEEIINEQYGGVLAMISRIVDGSLYMLDVLPEYHSRIDTKNGWKVKDLLFSRSAIEPVKDGLTMEVD